MLRESSAKEGKPATLRGVVDTAVDIGTLECDTLCELATGLVQRDRAIVDAAREDLVDSLGAEATVTAIGVVANFQMMNRALDAAGIPGYLDQSIANELGLDASTFGGAHALG